MLMMNHLKGPETALIHYTGDTGPKNNVTLRVNKDTGPKLMRHCESTLDSPPAGHISSARMMTVNIRCYHCLLLQNNALTASYNVSGVP